ncbi:MULTISPECIES: hypothetical protein [unclassified Wolbachia]|uniref:hypothetical protein n=1 Tax=unclassified Wolbachia TaxID=2640676 RepID=UPI00222773D9|nr:MULTISPECIES: hypothetical protein [unclassified Wolbachia]UZE38626.1 hypothetical protein ONI09_00430 [Wolbachia endosymbiont of Drosophila pseudotakahashii]
MTGKEVLGDILPGRPKSQCSHSCASRAAEHCMVIQEKLRLKRKLKQLIGPKPS